MTAQLNYVLIFSLLSLFPASSGESPPPDELYFPGFSGLSPGLLSLHGGAAVEPNGALRLTNDTLRVAGQAFFSEPFRLGGSASFSAALAFAAVPEYPRLGGHGLAFALSPTPSRPHALPSQYLGLFNSSGDRHVIAVEFDTVKDFEFGDPDDNHVGIDVDGLKSLAAAPASYFDESTGARETLSLKSGGVVLAWIDYDSSAREATVKLSPPGKKTEPNRTALSLRVDLSRYLSLERPTYVGFTASTGLLASSHYILGLSFKVNGKAKPLDLNSLPSVPSRAKKSRRNNIAAAVIGSVSAFSALALVSAALFYAVRRVREGRETAAEDWEREVVGPRRFGYVELRRATAGFGDKSLIGFGGFGKVYKGTLDDETLVAVKRVSHESKQGMREFASEISTIGRLRHRNLVHLLGWSRRKNDLLLVYEYMQNGSLDKFLFGEERERVLSWEERVKILRGCASGLLYLHEEWDKAVIHRDVKAGNVLLDSEMSGRLGDFGLAKLYEHGANPSTTRVVGTLGYLAPELTRTGKPTKESDVFAFGALLLEVACGRRPVEPKASPEELILVDWVWDKWRAGSVLDVVDPKLGGVFDEDEAVAALKLGLVCSSDGPEARPTMSQVVRYLDGEAAPLLPPDGCGGKKVSRGDGFEDFTHSYPPSSSVFERASTIPSGADDVEAGPVSPLTISR